MTAPPFPNAWATGRLRWFVGLEDTCVYPRPTDHFEPLDEHELTGHSRLWRSDLDRVAELGVDGVRYGLSWPKVHLGPGKFDWSALDPVIEHLQSLGLVVIADLVHYGCPPWLPASFVDDGFTAALTEFATEAVRRYGDAIDSVTPINEPLTTASFCGLRTVWPPGLGSWSGWANVVVSLATAAQSVTHAVRNVRPATNIVHVEAAHLYEAAAALRHIADHLGAVGDLATDLLVGTVDDGHPLRHWLLEHGISAHRLDATVRDAALPDVLGVNYYPDLTPRVLKQQPGGVVQIAVNRWTAGLGRVLRRLAQRYQLPLLVTETSIEADEAGRCAWLDAAVAELDALRSDGIDVGGLTWWPLIDFIDWSYIHDGVSVEEFVNGIVDEQSGELVPVPIQRRDRDDIHSFVRHMGLLDLKGADGNITHHPNSVYRRLAEHVPPPQRHAPSPDCGRPR